MSSIAPRCKKARWTKRLHDDDGKMLRERWDREQEENKEEDDDNDNEDEDEEDEKFLAVLK